jgi:hypothetical protein
VREVSSTLTKRDDCAELRTIDVAALGSDVIG